jgi:8-oxo-dGTP pyrophosphatase MutT (NUDIX family)
MWRLKLHLKSSLLHRKQNWRGWEYVKGGLLPGESLKTGLRREIREETGQKKFKIIAKLPKIVKYKWPQAYQKDRKKWQGAIQQVYLVEVFSQNIKLDRKEHSGYAWLPAVKAMKLLTHKEPKSALRGALERHFKRGIVLK